MRILLFTLCCLFFGANVQSQTINWANDVAPILYKHCVQCHRADAIGGFSLVGYQSAYTNRYGILDAVSNRSMPPWKADPNYRHYVGENYLTDAQIQTIEDWVSNDAPTGDISQAPQAPVFVEGSSVGIPDEVLQTPAYTMNATEDEYRCFVLPSGLSETKFLRGLEVIPGNHMAVHHVLVYEDVTGEGKIKDDQTPEPGYISFGGPGVQNARLIGSWVPGNQPKLFPPFMGVKLNAGADLIIQVHFPGSATGLTDQSTLNLFFTPTNQNIRQVSISPFLYHYPPSLQDGPLQIPANTVKTFNERVTVPQNASLISVAPHMHLIGRSIETFGVTAQGDTIPLVRIPAWDFNWQGAYTLQQVEKIPIGTKLYARAVYDNTPNNPFNPSSPPQDVFQGEATTDEMMLVYFTYMTYQAGDENIVLDSTLLASGLPELTNPAENIVQLMASPNPTTQFTHLNFELTTADEIHIAVFDVQGKMVLDIPSEGALSIGQHRKKLDLSAFPPGMYTVTLKNRKGGVMSTTVLRQ